MFVLCNISLETRIRDLRELECLNILLIVSA